MSRPKIVVDETLVNSVLATLKRHGSTGAKRADLMGSTSISKNRFLLVMTQLLESGTVVRRGNKRGTTWFLKEVAPEVVVVETVAEEASEDAYVPNYAVNVERDDHSLDASLPF